MPPPDEIRDDPGEYLVRRDTLREFNAILQRDATDTTYKYALLRALVEIAEQESHHVRPDRDGWVAFPLGLIVERWLYYYWPFIERRWPQKHAERTRGEPGNQLSFRKRFEAVTDYYARHGGFPQFVADLQRRGIPRAIDKAFRALQMTIRATLTDMPMRYLGVSRYKAEYQLADFVRRSTRPLPKKPLTRLDLITCLGTGLLRREYYETFRAVGGFATGAEAIFAQWAQFTARANARAKVSLADATGALLETPPTGPNVDLASQIFRRLLKDRGQLECAWTGARIVAPGTLAVDHAIPWSLWGSNALWNLLPASAKANASKSDRIPAPALIDARRTPIADYWQASHASAREAFQSDFRVSLAGMNVDFQSGNWAATGLASLKDKCAYLINERGYAPWTPNAS
ncbi:MAG TPA: HNH endonuclease domain-containing protein [Opitutaceae bacterium]